MGTDSGITIKTLLIDLIPFMDRIIRTMDYHLTDDQINSPTETMKTDRIMRILTTKVELGEITEIFLVHHQDKDGTFLKVILSADLNLINLEIRHSEGQTVGQPLVPLLTNKSFRKATIKHQRMSFVSPPLMIALTNYQNCVL